jgi:threonylcarbamoyladenosine tRNA methylthiotransferase MtaB
LRVRLESIGCRLNIGEIEALARQLSSSGCRIVAPGEDADLCIFNSCTVTSTASKKSRQIIRQLRRANPDAKVVATGCYSEMEPEEVRALGVDLVVGNHDKDRIPQLLLEKGLLEHDTDELNDAVDAASTPNHLRTRAFVKVQDGCDNKCTFCIVTVARGSGRSRPDHEVVSEILRLLDEGYNEVVLSGVHLGSYGHDLGRSRGLEELVNLILGETDLPRLRLSSLEPWDLDRDFFSLLENPRVLPHLHLPLQSGCDDTLRRMARKTDQRAFSALVAAARSAADGVSISTDVIAGFPGETDEEFEQSIAFVESMEFSKLHVFKFSSRQGTRAATMPHQVRGPVAQARSRRLIELGARMEHEFNHRFVGSELPVLWEQGESVGPHQRWTGLTDNYIRCVTETQSEVDLSNRVTATRLISTIPGGVLGEIDGITIPEIIEPESRRPSEFGNLPIKIE